MCHPWLLGLLLMLSVTVAQGAEPVANGDFRQGQYMWIPDLRDGVLSAEFVDGVLTIGRHKEGYARVYQDIVLAPGSYRFSCNLKTLTPRTVVHFWLILKNDQGQYLEKEPIYLSAHFVNDQWKVHGRDIEVGTGIVGARLCMTVNGEQGKAIIDDVKVAANPKSEVTTEK